MEQGWIKISRSITNHWIWKDPIKFKWWMDILLIANYEPKRVSIGYKVFECNRGECLMSLKSWGERWGVSKTVVNNFFTMLENDNMIKTVNETVTTRLTICNYDSYQQKENGTKTETKRIKNATETQQSTTKEREEREEREEEINIQKFNFKKSLIDLGIENNIASDWMLVRRKKGYNTETAFNKIKSELEKSPLSANESIKIAVEKNWVGFEAEWIINLKIAQPQVKQSSILDYT